MTIFGWRFDPFPERRAGGFTRFDGSVNFYVRVRALLATPDVRPVVVDFGAGRGSDLDDALPIHAQLLDLRTTASRVIGIDIDESVLMNPRLTDAHVISAGDPIPMPDQSADMVLLDHVLEHITDPAPVASELHRILRPGGWICARTPNKWGYVAIASRLIPNHWHTRLLRLVQPDRRAEDVFPTFYRLNTRRAIKTAFPPEEFEHIVYTWEPEPAYAGRSTAMAMLFTLLRRATPDRVRPVLLIFLRRRQHPGPIRSW